MPSMHNHNRYKSQGSRSERMLIHFLREPVQGIAALLALILAATSLGSPLRAQPSPAVDLATFTVESMPLPEGRQFRSPSRPGDWSQALGFAVGFDPGKTQDPNASTYCSTGRKPHNRVRSVVSRSPPRQGWPHRPSSAY